MSNDSSVWATIVLLMPVSDDGGGGGKIKG